jgi:insertion element IS1 protein InsB
MWVWTVVDKKRSGIIRYVVGDRSAKTFAKLWKKIERNPIFGLRMAIKFTQNLSPMEAKLLVKHQ